MKYLHELEADPDKELSMEKKKVIVVLPAYNAARTLAITLKDIPRDVVDEVLLVDDASTDNTAALARELGIRVIRHEQNRGYGGNQKTCYNEALRLGADVVVMVHPDYQYDPTAITRLIDPILKGKADAVFGSRMMKGGALQGGIAFSNASVALVHGMSRPIGAHFHVSHGLSNAMLMPVVTQWSAPAALPRYATCARAMGIADDAESDQSAVGRLVEALHRINADLSVPSPAAYGIDKARWDDLVPVMAAQALASGSPANNPRVPDAEEIAALYAQAWN